jgi:hypothetical protein
MIDETFILFFCVLLASFHNAHTQLSGSQHSVHSPTMAHLQATASQICFSLQRGHSNKKNVILFAITNFSLLEFI